MLHLEPSSCMRSDCHASACPRPYLSYPFRAIVQCPDGLINVYTLAERVAKCRPLGYGSHCRLEEIHVRVCFANPAEKSLYRPVTLHQRKVEGNAVVCSKVGWQSSRIDPVVPASLPRKQHVNRLQHFNLTSSTIASTSTPSNKGIISSSLAACPRHTSFERAKSRLIANIAGPRCAAFNKLWRRGVMMLDARPYERLQT